MSIPFTILGMNHTTAALAVREQAVFVAKNLPYALQALKEQVNEAVILSTCNRTEIYTDMANFQQLFAWFRKQQMDNIPLESYCYHYCERDAIRHLMRVSCGLDSMILGEPQILGQIKEAFMIARAAGSVGTQLEKIFQRVFAVSKQIRSNTQLGVSPLSLAYTTVTLAKRIFADCTRSQVLLIGAGNTINWLMTHFHGSGMRRMIVANRSKERAQLLADKFAARCIGLQDIPVYLKEADIVVAATSSPLPILGKGAIESALKARKRRPILMVDMAVPRDIEPEVANLTDVYLYNIEDLQAIISDNHKSREHAAKQAEAILEIQVDHFMRELQGLKAVPAICALREKIAALSKQELEKAIKDLQQGLDPELALTQLANGLSNKVLHTPTVKLREAAYDGQPELLAALQKLFEI